jgi:hypothetical protein
MASFADLDLASYNLLVIPEGSAGRLWRELGTVAPRSSSWVSDGATVIAMGGSVGLLARKELELTTSAPLERDTTAVKDTTITRATVPAPPLVSPAATGGTAPAFIPGSIFRATLDRTHWLTFGYQGDHLPVMLETSVLRTPSSEGANRWFHRLRYLLSGWSAPERGRDAGPPSRPRSSRWGGVGGDFRGVTGGAGILARASQTAD